MGRALTIHEGPDSSSPTIAAAVCGLANPNAVINTAGAQTSSSAGGLSGGVVALLVYVPQAAQNEVSDVGQLLVKLRAVCHPICAPRLVAQTRCSSCADLPLLQLHVLSPHAHPLLRQVPLPEGGSNGVRTGAAAARTTSTRKRRHDAGSHGAARSARREALKQRLNRSCSEPPSCSSESGALQLDLDEHVCSSSVARATTAHTAQHERKSTPYNPNEAHSAMAPWCGKGAHRCPHHLLQRRMCLSCSI